MPPATRDELRRERSRAYAAVCDDARARLAVLKLVVDARERRAATSGPLEEGFAAAGELPAAAWVALRRGDLDGALDLLREQASEHMVVDEFEELDETSYRLVTKREERPVPDAAALQEQVGTFVQIPADVLNVVCGWGTDDPRTQTEVETLIADRYDSAPAQSAPRPALEPTARTEAQARPTADAAVQMTSAEFAALLALPDAQRQALARLVAQTGLTIVP